MELSKAPRLTPFMAWGGSCEGASVLAGGEGAAAGGGGGGGGGGNADIPLRILSKEPLSAGLWAPQGLFFFSFHLS